MSAGDRVEPFHLLQLLQPPDLHDMDRQRWRERAIREHESTRRRQLDRLRASVSAVLADFAAALGWPLVEIDEGEWRLGDDAVGADVVLGARSVSLVSHWGCDGRFGPRNRDRLLATLHERTGLPVSFAWSSPGAAPAGFVHGAERTIVYPRPAVTPAWRASAGRRRGPAPRRSRRGG